MYYSAIKRRDIANGIGVRVSLFVSGCTNRCEGCFQPQTWDFAYGSPFTPQTERTLLEMLAPGYIAGLTLLGGEPFEPDNQKALLPFIRRMKQIYPDKSVWGYSGFTLERLIEKESGAPRCGVTDELLRFLDVLIDGPFILKEKDISLRFRGSRNQRILDVAASVRTGHPVLWNE